MDSRVVDEEVAGFEIKRDEGVKDRARAPGEKNPRCCCCGKDVVTVKALDTMPKRQSARVVSRRFIVHFLLGRVDCENGGTILTEATVL
jgi:hypothetical protein